MTTGFRRLGMLFALYAAFVLTLPSCSGTEEIWLPETIIEETPLGPVSADEQMVAGQLQLTLSREVRARESAVERLHLRHTESHSDHDANSFGLVFFSILGGILTVGLYFAVAFLLIDTDDD